MSDGIGMAAFGVLLLVVLAAAGLYGCPKYNVYVNEQSGMAELSRATQNRKIKIEEAVAQKEAAKALAEAEIERARGVAKANKIIGDSLKGNEAYLRYLWIQGLQQGATPQVVYVPTEAGLPILEAGRTNGKGEKPDCAASVK